MTLFFRSDQITIYRNRRIGSSHTFAMSATFTVYNADIQPASPDRQQLAEGRFGAVYTGFIDSTVDIQEGDQIQVVGGKRYSVKGIQYFGGAGLLDHKELLLVAQDG